MARSLPKTVISLGPVLLLACYLLYHQKESLWAMTVYRKAPAPASHWAPQLMSGHEEALQEQEQEHWQGQEQGREQEQEQEHGQEQGQEYRERQDHISKVRTVHQQSHTTYKTVMTKHIPPIFTNSGPLGRISHRVAMSRCVFAPSGAVFF